jgi:hypothetical protein
LPFLFGTLRAAPDVKHQKAGSIGDCYRAAQLPGTTNIYSRNPRKTFTSGMDGRQAPVEHQRGRIAAQTQRRAQPFLFLMLTGCDVNHLPDGAAGTDAATLAAVHVLIDCTRG